jgi:predicted permease
MGMAMTRIRFLLRNLFGRRRADQDLEAEVRSYQSLLEEEKLLAGMPFHQARREARLELGGPEQVKEQVRHARAGAWLESLGRDLRFAARMLRKNPGFTAVAVFTLALGVGANAAIFSVMEAQLWRPLPFPDSERLVDAHLVLRTRPQWDVLPERVFRAWRSDSRTFTGLAGSLYPQFRNLTANGTSQRVLVMATTANFFDTLELLPERGRAFRPEEETVGREREVILSHALWENSFGSDPNVLGKPILMDGDPYVIVGIASPRLRFEYFSEEPAIYVPLAMEDANGVLVSTRLVRNLYTIGRLAPGATAQSARAELEGILQRQLQQEPITPEPMAAVENLRQTWTDFAAAPLYFFGGAVALVLLIACVNTAGLLLARSLARQREFALRAALGARAATLIRQSLTESLLLSGAGSMVGTVLGIWLSRSGAAFIPSDKLPRHAPIQFDSRAWLFAVAACFVSALLVGILPGIFASRVDSNRLLGQASRSVSSGVNQRRARTILVSIEVALGLVLLFGAGLFLSSFVRLEEAPRGFDAPGALTFRVGLRGNDYDKPEQIERYFSRLTDQLGSIPGVQEVTLGSGLPLAGSNLWGNVNVAGRPPARPYGTYVDVFAVAPNYVQALHMHLLAGRAFNAHDTADSVAVAMLNRNVAEELFGTEDPLGKVLDFVAQPKRGVPPEPSVEIVGVLENAQQFNANEVPQDDLYVPFAQRPSPTAYVLLESAVPRGPLTAAVRAATYNLDKNQPVYDMKTMDERVDESVSGARFDLFLVAGLAGVAMLLVCIGVFGTVSYFVEQRTQEFGIRLALGASPARLLRHAIRQAMFAGGIGLALGMGLSLALGRLLRHALYLAPHEHTGMLYGVSIYDPLSMSIACVILLAALLLASYLPARRAMRVDPMVALRHE